MLKSKAKMGKGERRARFARAINPFLARFRIALIYTDNRWQIVTNVLKSHHYRKAHSSGTVNWSLNAAHALPLNNNLARSLASDDENKTSGRKKKKKVKARRYISPKVGVEKTFRKLNEASIKYAVLRWFDTLPDIEPGEDIDMLVADEAVDILDEFFLKKRVKGGIPCDIYSESGMRGNDFQGLPYYDKRLATELLDNAIMHNDLVKVPSPKHHFLSLAYHALYHKAQASGLGFADGEPPISQINDHDYARVLSELGRELDISVNTTLLGLRETLEQFDWNPSIDTIRKLALTRPILNRLLGGEVNDKRLIDMEVSTFIVRSWAYEQNLLPWILANIRHFGFDIKLIRVLDSSEQDRARLYIRGGNWNRGPYRVSGGDPAVVIAICDYASKPVGDETLLKQPYVKSERLVDLKRILRDGINNYLPKALKVNAIHSSDDEVEALHYLKAIDEGLPEQFISLCEAGFEGDPFTKLILHEGRRATTYIVFRDGKPCILKVFSECDDGRQSHLNEAQAPDIFAGKSWVPKVYASGTNWILQEYFGQRYRLDRLVKNMTKEEKLAAAGKIVSVISQLHKMGFAHRDIHAGNIFIVNGVVKLIDYETLIEEDSNIPLSECYDITGKGLDSPFATGRMCYSKTTEGISSSLKSVLDVPIADAMDNMSAV